MLVDFSSLSHYFILVSLSSFSFLFCSLPFKPKTHGGTPSPSHHGRTGPLSQAIATHHHHRPNLRLLSVGGSVVGLSSPALFSSSWVSQVCLVWLRFMGCDSLSDGFWPWVLVMFWPWVLLMFVCFFFFFFFGSGGFDECGCGWVCD